MPGLRPGQLWSFAFSSGTIGRTAPRARTPPASRIGEIDKMKYPCSCSTRSTAQGDHAMSPTIAFLASFASILIGTATGMILKRSLPRTSSKAAQRIHPPRRRVSGDAGGAGDRPDDRVRKEHLRHSEHQLRQLGTNAVLVDELLIKYGPEARAARTLLRETIPSATARIWRENTKGECRRIDLRHQRHRRAILPRDRKPEAGQCGTKLA